MLRKILAALGMALTVVSAHASTPAEEGGQAQELLGRLVGRWVMTGTMGRRSTVHDVEGAWALQHHYVRLIETSRERGDNGLPKYEATIFIGWVEAAHHYICIWLDNTDVASGDISCFASEAPNSIPFEFRDSHGALTITNTFTFHPASDTWDWRIDNVRDGVAEPFARVSLHRRRPAGSRR